MKLDMHDMSMTLTEQESYLLHNMQQHLHQSGTATTTGNSSANDDSVVDVLSTPPISPDVPLPVSPDAVIATPTSSCAMNNMVISATSNYPNSVNLSVKEIGSVSARAAPVPAEVEQVQATVAESKTKSNSGGDQNNLVAVPLSALSELNHLMQPTGARRGRPDLMINTNIAAPVLPPPSSHSHTND